MVRQWLLRYADLIDQNAPHLTELDAAIGDGDHGANMVRGMAKVRSRLLEADTSLQDTPTLLRSVGMALISNVGGAVGPLYGAFFLRISRELEANAIAGALTPAQIATVFAAGVDGIHQRGKAEPGEKTMLDALLPASETMRTAVEQGASLEAMLARARYSAQIGARETIPMEATKGRASYLGVRSIGHQDPGATSAALLVEALYDSVATASPAATHDSTLPSQQNAGQNTSQKTGQNA